MLNQISMSCFYMCGFLRYNNPAEFGLIFLNLSINSKNYRVWMDGFVAPVSGVWSPFKRRGWRGLPPGAAGSKVRLLSKFSRLRGKVRRRPGSVDGTFADRFLEIRPFLFVFGAVTEEGCPWRGLRSSFTKPAR